MGERLCMTADIFVIFNHIFLLFVTTSKLSQVAYDDYLPAPNGWKEIDLHAGYLQNSPKSSSRYIENQDWHDREFWVPIEISSQEILQSTKRKMTRLLRIDTRVCSGGLS